MYMYTKEELKQAMDACLNDREKDIIRAKFGVDVELMLPEYIFEKYRTDINEIRYIEKIIANYIRENRHL